MHVRYYYHHSNGTCSATRFTECTESELRAILRTYGVMFARHLLSGHDQNALRWVQHGAELNNLKGRVGLPCKGRSEGGFVSFSRLADYIIVSETYKFEMDESRFRACLEKHIESHDHNAYRMEDEDVESAQPLLRKHEKEIADYMLLYSQRRPMTDTDWERFLVQAKMPRLVYALPPGGPVSPPFRSPLTHFHHLHGMPNVSPEHIAQSPMLKRFYKHAKAQYGKHELHGLD